MAHKLHGIIFSISLHLLNCDLLLLSRPEIDQCCANTGCKSSLVHCEFHTVIRTWWSDVSKGKFSCKQFPVQKEEKDHTSSMSLVIQLYFCNPYSRFKSLHLVNKSPVLYINSEKKLLTAAHIFSVFSSVHQGYSSYTWLNALITILVQYCAFSNKTVLCFLLSLSSSLSLNHPTRLDAN